MNPLLELTGITKRFGEVVALEGVSLRISPGRIIALLGENGAGKSTLMRICDGLLRPDAGEIAWDGQPVHLTGPAVARSLGIGMVHQHFTLVPAMTVAENLALAAPPKGVQSPSALVRSANALMERTGLKVDPCALAGDLPVGLQQRVEILKALSAPVRLLILDEPTAVLTPRETTELFNILRQLRDDGASIVLITHKLPEALAIAQEVVVLRHGRVVLDANREEVNAEALSTAMVGRTLEQPEALIPLETGEIIVSSPLLACPGQETGVIRAGEVLGVAGVDGNGQSELAESMIGLRNAPVTVYTGASLSPADEWPIAERIAWGMAHIPDDRHTTGLALQASVRDNLFLAGDTLPRFGVFIDRKRAESTARDLVDRYDVRTSGMSAPVSELSGGNQQKLIVAREMNREPKLLVAVNPTRGLDIGATGYVHQTIKAHRERGGATLLISNELEELLGLSDRIAVLYAGRFIGEVLPGAPEARERIGRMMTGTESEA